MQKHAISRDQALEKGGRDGEENGHCGVQNLPGSRWDGTSIALVE